MSEHSGVEADSRAKDQFWALLEDAPVTAYLLRAVPGDFVLEAVNAAARERSPALSNMIGRVCTILYRDQPEIIAAAFRCMRERRTVTERAQVRKHYQVEANEAHELVYVYLEADRLIIYANEVSGLEGLAAALQESETRYRSVVASLPDAVLLRGSDDRVLTCNDVAIQLFGHRALGDVLGQVDVLAAGYRIETEAGVAVDPADYPSRRVLRTGLRVVGALYKLQRPDGSQTFLRVSSEPVLTRSGAIGASVTLYTDVTERLRLEDELRQAQRLESIGRLAGGLAHDFNNLLTAMLGSLELVSDLCPASAAADLATIRHGAERARELTRQLLAFARKQPIVLEVVDVGLLVGKIERLLQRLVGPGVALQIGAGAELCVRADAAQLEQVLVNLVVNARDAMPSGGQLSVRVQSRDTGGEEWVDIEVEDRGVGMAPETLRHVFDPFFSTKASGTGLGLASSYGVVKQHGGDIRVESELGRGSCFRVSLPRVSGRESRPSAPAPALSGQGLVLVVDDEELVRDTTGRLLESLGYQVLLAADGEQALALVRRHAGSIDVLLCDVAMPGRSGPEVARDVLEVCSSIQVLFMSGYPEGGERVVSRHGFLQKPYSRAALGAKLSALREAAVRVSAAERGP